mgnify:CR=1 FL=1
MLLMYEMSREPTRVECHRTTTRQNNLGKNNTPVGVTREFWNSLGQLTSSRGIPAPLQLHCVARLNCGQLKHEDAVRFILWVGDDLALHWGPSWAVPAPNGLGHSQSLTGGACLAQV